MPNVSRKHAIMAIQDANDDPPSHSGKKARRMRQALSASHRTARDELDVIFSADPDLIFPTLFAVKSGQIMKQSADVPSSVKNEVGDDPYWNRRYRNHDRIPVYWLACWMCQMCPQVFQATFLSTVSAKKPEAIRELLEFGTGLAKSAKLYKPLLLKVLTSRYYTERCVRYGERYMKTEWAEKCLDHESSELRWDRGGVYEWVTPGVLKHISGVQVIWFALVTVFELGGMGNSSRTSPGGWVSV